MERTETSTMIGLHSTQKESGTKVYTCLCYSLWYVYSSHAFFKERGCPTQNLFIEGIITSENIMKINLLAYGWFMLDENSNHILRINRSTKTFQQWNNLI